MMRILKGMLLSCLLFLHGCDSVYGQNSVYEQKNGAWYYDGRKIDVNQPGSFKPLKARFATGADGGSPTSRDKRLPLGTSFKANLGSARNELSEGIAFSAICDFFIDVEGPVTLLMLGSK